MARGEWLPTAPGWPRRVAKLAPNSQANGRAKGSFARETRLAPASQLQAPERAPRRDQNKLTCARLVRSTQPPASRPKERISRFGCAQIFERGEESLMRPTREHGAI